MMNEAYSKAIILGRNIRAPTTIAITAETSTAAAL
jgi:hypothetical protein